MKKIIDIQFTEQTAEPEKKKKKMLLIYDSRLYIRRRQGRHCEGELN